VIIKTIASSKPTANKAQNEIIPCQMTRMNGKTRVGFLYHMLHRAKSIGKRSKSDSRPSDIVSLVSDDGSNFVGLHTDGREGQMNEGVQAEGEFNERHTSWIGMDQCSNAMIPAIVESDDALCEKAEKEESAAEGGKDEERMVIDIDFEYSSSSEFMDLYSVERDGDIDLKMCIDKYKEEDGRSEKTEKRREMRGKWRRNYHKRRLDSDDRFGMPKKRRRWPSLTLRAKRHKENANDENSIAVAEMSVVTPDDVDFSFSLDDSSELSDLAGDVTSFEQDVSNHLTPTPTINSDHSLGAVGGHSGLSSNCDGFCLEGTDAAIGDQCWCSNFIDSKAMTYRYG